MQIGTLVKHIEREYIGVVVREGVAWSLIHFSDDAIKDRWCTECELEVLCK